MGNFKRDKRDNRFGGKRDGGFSGHRSDRSDRPEMHRTVCSECGSSCEVPFRPTGDKPVFCSDCFADKRGGSDSRGFEKRDSRRFDSSEKTMFQAVCAECGEDCEIPFKPKSDKPVYCSHCFGKKEKSENSKTDNKQLEAINAKLDKILKMLTPVASEEKEIVKSKKSVETIEEEVKPKKATKSKEKKVAVKKEKVKKKK